MTATPRLYSDDSKSKAAQAEAILCSMDDPKLYGEEIYRIGFGEAVERDLLTDYKVLILTLNDKDVPPAVQKMIADDKKRNQLPTMLLNSSVVSMRFQNKFSVMMASLKALILNRCARPSLFVQRLPFLKRLPTMFNTATDAYISSLPTKKKDQMVRSLPSILMERCPHLNAMNCLVG